MFALYLYFSRYYFYVIRNILFLTLSFIIFMNFDLLRFSRI